MDIVKSGSFAQKGQCERVEQRDLSNWPLTGLRKALALPGTSSLDLRQDYSGCWERPQLTSHFPEGCAEVEGHSRHFRTGQHWPGAWVSPCLALATRTCVGFSLYLHSLKIGTYPKDA